MDKKEVLWYSKLVIGLILIVSCFVFWRPVFIMLGSEVTKATAIQLIYGSKSKKRILYSFSVNNEIYTGRCGVYDDDEIKMNDTFCIIYSSYFPTISISRPIFGGFFTPLNSEICNEDITYWSSSSY